MNTALPESVEVGNDSVSTWYAKATVRTRPRIIVPTSVQGEDIYPRSRQPIASHQIVRDLGEDAVRYVLNQSTYKYMYEIGLLETKFVIDCALKIANRQIYPEANDRDRLDAITIVIDEGYHAHVALDFITQMKRISGVQPISVPTTNGNLNAVARTAAMLPDDMQDIFELVAVCLAEHTLTKDLLSIGKEHDATRTFTQVMTDHVADEGRHAGYFSRVLGAAWSLQGDGVKRTIGVLLPIHLEDYLASDDERLFDRQVLSAIGLDAIQVDRVLSDTKEAYLADSRAYITKTKANLVALLKRIGILNDADTRAAFVMSGLLDAVTGKAATSVRPN
jgi:P-aminobenzoate N-oxygenase AurF